MEKETIPCTTCGTPTTMLGTKLCNNCWEVQRRLWIYVRTLRGCTTLLKAVLRGLWTLLRRRLC